MAKGGARPGAGRPKRKEAKAKPIWCGQMEPKHREFILKYTTPDQRMQALIAMALSNTLAKPEEK